MQGMTDAAAAAAFGTAKAPLMEPEPNLKCPRCDSTNTKFCYYNNYNLSQPRHFCKDCRRYWTKGGSLRAVPVGGGSRKNSKRSSAAAAASSNPKRLSPASADAAADEFPKPELLSVSFAPVDDDNRLHDISDSLLSSTAQFGSFFEFYHLLDSMPVLRDVNRPLSEPEPEPQSSADGNCGGAMAQPPHSVASFVGDSSSWAGGWPDLSIYNPSSSSQ